MEVIQNNVVQNLMAMFPMRPAEVILQCVTHPRNCYEPVDEGVLLNRCIDDLLSREDALDDDTKVKDDEPGPNVERFEDFVVDDVIDGDPVVVDDPEVTFPAFPDIDDIDVEELLLETPKKDEICIDLTKDSPLLEKKGVTNSSDISTTSNIRLSTNEISLNSTSKKTVKSVIDETDGDLPDLGFSFSPSTSLSQQSKVKTPTNAMPAVTPTSLGKPKTIGDPTGKNNPVLGNPVTNSVPSKCDTLKFAQNKLAGSPGIQITSQNPGTHQRTAFNSGTGMSSASKAMTGETINTHSRPVAIDGQSKSVFQSTNTSQPSLKTSYNFQNRQAATTCNTGVATTSTLSTGGTFNAQTKPVVMNGHLREHQLQKMRIHVGQNGNYVVGPSKALTVRQELQRKRAIPATLSRAPSDEIKPSALVTPPANNSGTSEVIDLATGDKNKEKVILPNLMINNTAAKNGSNPSSSAIRIQGNGIPVKVNTPTGFRLHSKAAATLSRAPSDSSLDTAKSFQPASRLPLGSNSNSTPNSQINGTGSRQTVTTAQSGQIKPVILKTDSMLPNGISQGTKSVTWRIDQGFKSSLATNKQPGVSVNIPNPTGNVILVSASSSAAVQVMPNPNSGQYVGGNLRLNTPILPKNANNGTVKPGSAFSLVRQRPAATLPQTSNPVQTQPTTQRLGVNQLASGVVNNNIPGSTNIKVRKDYDNLLYGGVNVLRKQQKQIEMLRKELAKYKPPAPLQPLEPLPLHPPRPPLPMPNLVQGPARRPLPPALPLPVPVQGQAGGLPNIPPAPLPIPVQGPPGGLPNVPVTRPDPAPRQAAPEAPAAAATNAAGGMEAASVELENMVQQVMKMFPTADKVVVRGMLLEHRNVNATCNYLLENPDAANNGGVPVADPVPTVNKEVQVDYINIDPNKRGFIPNYPQYFNQGLDILSNDFIKISKTSLRLVMQSLCRGSYAKTRNILEEAIEADPNIKVMMADDTKGSFFHVQKDGRKFEIRLMKKARKPIHIIQTMHPELQKEVNFYKKHIINETEKSDFEVALKLNEDQYEQEGQLIECGCCCMEVTFENMIQCLEGHLFCQTCLQRYTKEAVYGQGKATLSCLEDGCDSVFPRSQLEKTLSKDILVKYDERVVEESINMAEMDNLLRCPNCNYAAVLDKDHKVFSCPECHKETCRNCKEPWKDHYGLECDQVKKQSTMRLSYQERMTEAKVRTCYKCGTKFCKSEGCNKMTCRCGAKMCYICRQPIKDYSHFDNKAAPPRGQIWQPRPGEKCRLWTNSDEDDDRAVKEIERQMKAEEKNLREKAAADLKRPSESSTDEGGDAKRPRTG